MALRALPVVTVLAHSMGFPPPCPWPRTPCQPPRLPLILPTAQDPIEAPWICQPLPHWCYSRAGLQLPTSLPWLAMGPVKLGSTVGPCLQGGAWWPGLWMTWCPQAVLLLIGHGMGPGCQLLPSRTWGPPGAPGTLTVSRKGACSLEALLIRILTYFLFGNK